MKSGKYAPRTERHVYHWPAPDKDGDGPVVKVRGDDGRQVDKTDANGNKVRRYKPPAGFRNHRSDDGTDNYVLTDEYGDPVRDHNDIAAVLPEGGLFIRHPDGSHESVPPEGVPAWEDAHEHVGELDVETDEDDEDDGPEGSE